MEQAQPVAWYWTVIGVLIIVAFLYFSMKWIRDKGKGSVAEWLRKVWPPKVSL